MQIGIDEAGRGPVIGPLVIAGVVVSEEQINVLQKIGVKDSKLLSARMRELLFDQVKENVSGFEIIEVWPEEIDDVLLRSESNLNWLEADKSVEILEKLSGDVGIIDCPSTNPPKYKEYVVGKLGKKMEIVCEHKADARFTSVGAASILAKVVRDRIIKKLHEEFGDFGSGYPSDPLTQQFLKKEWNRFPYFRKSWDSWKKVKESKAQMTLDF